MNEPLIVIDNLQRSFGSVRAVNGLSLSVDSGQIYGLVGPDGAGKTTTLRILCGALLPDGGAARVGGLDVVRQPDGVRSLLGYMPQRFSLYGDLTVGENMRFFADIFHVPRREQRALIDRLLAFSRLDRFESRLAARLSGGMKQKLALACALIHRPTVLLLDEPTTGVDPVSRREFWEIVREAVADGMTVLVSTPYMDEAERCHQVAFVAGGKVLAAGTPHELQRLVPGSTLELAATPQRQAAATLGRLPAVRDVQLFGDLLHVGLHQPIASPQLQSILAADGVTVGRIREVTPSMEDVFMYLSTTDADHRSPTAA